MTVLDADTVAVVASAVLLTTALLYLATSIARRDRSGARLWAFGFLLTVLGIVAYFVWWTGEDGSWGAIVALAIAQGATVGAAGCYTLGFLSYQPRPLEGPAFAVTALALLCVAVTIADAVTGSGGVVQPWTSVAVGGLMLWTTASAMRGALRRMRITWVAAGASAVNGVFTLARAVIEIVAGPESELSAVWFGPTANNLMTVTVGLVFGICLFVLRTSIAGAPGYTASARVDEVLTADEFRAHLRAVLRRSTPRMENVAVIAARIDALDAIASAFGGDISEDMTLALQRSARRFAAPIALVGEGPGPTVIFVASLAASQADARRQAGLLYRGIVQDFIAGRDVVLPGIGVGVALSQTIGYDVDALMAGAHSAASTAAANDESSVEFAVAVAPVAE